MVLLERSGSPDAAVLRAFEEVKATGEVKGRSAWWVATTFRNIQRCEYSHRYWGIQGELGKLIWAN